MSFFDRIFGQNNESPTNAPASFSRSADEIAVERYRYLLRTAPPETIEQVHRDAFAKLTPQQRDIMFEQLTISSPRGERPASNDVSSLAASATRSEIRNPGSMERTLAGNGQAMGFGGTVGSSMLGTVAGFVVASTLMSMFLPGPDVATDAGAAGAGSDAGTDPGADLGGEAPADFGGGFGGDFGDFGF